MSQNRAPMCELQVQKKPPSLVLLPLQGQQVLDWVVCSGLTEGALACHRPRDPTCMPARRALSPARLRHLPEASHAHPTSFFHRMISHSGPRERVKSVQTVQPLRRCDDRRQES